MTVTVVFTQDKVESKVLQKHVYNEDTLEPSTQCLGLKNGVYKKFDIEDIQKGDVPEKHLYFGMIEGARV